MVIGVPYHPLIAGWIILEDQRSILNLPRSSPSYIYHLPNHHSTTTHHRHWQISTLPPPQLGLRELRMNKNLISIAKEKVCNCCEIIYLYFWLSQQLVRVTY